MCITIFDFASDGGWWATPAWGDRTPASARLRFSPSLRRKPIFTVQSSGPDILSTIESVTRPSVSSKLESDKPLRIIALREYCSIIAIQ
jgi:hypothetical protein